MKIQIASMTIVYNYNECVIDNIKSYADYVDIAYIFDNSEKENYENKDKINKIKNVVYIKGNGNEGISIPINKVADLAIEEGCSWLITFDQDSVASENMIEQMRKFVLTHDSIRNIGIVAPTIKSQILKFATVGSEYSYYDKVIQSGAMHNLNVLKDIEGYDENLFIDQVDCEYCIRMRMHGYKIVKLNNVILQHNMQDEKVKLKYINGKKIYIDKYSPARYYYIIRNNLYCIKKFKKVEKLYVLECKRNIEVLKMGIPYEKMKFKKIKAIVKGYLDYYLKKMGANTSKM